MMRKILPEKHPSAHRGFTLIEVLVAATVISVLMSVGFASYSRVNVRSRDSKRKSDIEQIRSALEMYRADIGSYPGALSADVDGWANVGNAGWTSTLVPTYIAALPTDPKNVSPYVYKVKLNPPINGKYYGYCLSVAIESETNPDDTCTPYTGQNYGVKSP